MNRDMMARLSQMQEQLAKAQEDMENRVAAATSGGGAVKVEVTGGYRVKSLAIDPDVVDPDDMGMLEDLVIAAMNEALQQVQAFQAEQFSGLTGGLNITGLPGAGGGGGMPANRAARRANKR
jgi:DNA-binding YbaB/EbfC family protein